MSKRAALYFGSAALIAQIFVFCGCSSSTGTTPVTTGSGGAGGSATGTGGTSSTGTGGSTFTGPVGALCDTTVKNKAACTDGSPACFNTCGPIKSGIKNCTCSGGTWMCPTCAFDPAGDYSCYKNTGAVLCPADPTDPVNGLPKSGNPCGAGVTTCHPCGSGTGNAYRDSTNTPKIGWCVCTADDGTGVYSCASTSEWPPTN
jgi:hypothetical protein